MTTPIQTEPVRLELPDLATRAQVAEYLQLSVSTLARWAVEGRGPQVTKFGGAARYRRADVLAYVEQSAAQR